MYYVYKFINKENNIIYIGRTDNLNNRMGQHLSKNSNIPKICYKEIYNIYYTEFENINDMRIFEIYCIDKYNPKYNMTYNNNKIKSCFNIEEPIWNPLDISIIKGNISNTKINIESEPFKNILDINNISKHFIKQKKYRDNLLFILGINFGLKATNLLKLKFNDILNYDFTFKKTCKVIEYKHDSIDKTRIREVLVNKSVISAVKLFLKEYPNTILDDYLFTSQMPDIDYSLLKNDKITVVKGSKRFISLKQTETIINNVTKELHIKGNFSSSSLRKTFEYHMIQKNNTNPNIINLIKGIYGYKVIGITQDEIDNAYKTLNLGQEELIDSDIYEN